jgi:hypothetical protein
MKYPFKPKSTAYMQAGQFWPIALSSGGFACGIVLDIEKGSRRGFLAGLLDWCGTHEPTEQDIQGCNILEQGEGHIKMIQEGYGSITGILRETPTPLVWTEHRGGKDYGLYRGLELIEIINKDQSKKYPNVSSWGYNVINILAEKKYGTQPEP